MVKLGSTVHPLCLSFFFIFLGTQSESSEKSRPAVGEGEFNQETASAKINIKEHVGLMILKQKLQRQLDATGTIIALS